MTSDESVPDWLRAGWPHIWLPYTQMQTAQMPPAAIATDGTRIHLSDGRSLIDGMASWLSLIHI